MKERSQIIANVKYHNSPLTLGYARVATITIISQLRDLPMVWAAGREVVTEPLLVEEYPLELDMRAKAVCASAPEISGFLRRRPEFKGGPSR
jgi:hypothetical protein